MVAKQTLGKLTRFAPLFLGLVSQRSLFHVLHCFSMYCSECGYCQGMGPIAATLLCYLDAPVSGELLLAFPALAHQSTDLLACRCRRLESLLALDQASRRLSIAQHFYSRIPWTHGMFLSARTVNRVVDALGIHIHGELAGD